MRAFRPEARRSANFWSMRFGMAERERDEQDFQVRPDEQDFHRPFAFQTKKSLRRNLRTPPHRRRRTQRRSPLLRRASPPRTPMPEEIASPPRTTRKSSP